MEMQSYKIILGVYRLKVKFWSCYIHRLINCSSHLNYIINIALESSVFHNKIPWPERLNGNLFSHSLETGSLMSECHHSQVLVRAFLLTCRWLFSRCIQTWLRESANSQVSLLIRGSESCSIVSDSLQPRGLYSPWHYPGQNTGVGSCSLL